MMTADLGTPTGTVHRSTTTSVRPGRLPRAVACLFLWTSGIHVGIVAADPDSYRSFADGALPAVREAWSGVFVSSPVAWGLAVAMGELLIGLATLRSGRWTVLGLQGAIGFHLCLLLFGWAFWLWSLPALGVLVRGAVREARRAS